MTAAYPFCHAMLKQALLAVAGIALFVGGGFAGHFATTDWPGPVNWFGRPLDAVVLEKLTTELQLTPDQAARVAPVIKDACSDMRMISESVSCAAMLCRSF